MQGDSQDVVDQAPESRHHPLLNLDEFASGNMNDVSPDAPLRSLQQYNELSGPSKNITQDDVIPADEELVPNSYPESPSELPSSAMTKIVEEDPHIVTLNQQESEGSVGRKRNRNDMRDLFK